MRDGNAGRRYNCWVGAANSTKIKPPASGTDGPSPSRNLFVDGGQPSGKKKFTDNLNIFFYASPRPKFIQSAATQDPDAGIVDMDNNTARFVVQYDDIEQVRPPKAAR